MLGKLLIMIVLGVVWGYDKSTVSVCLWHNNTCVDYCPEWMVEVKSNCTNSYWRSQRTCDRPYAILVGTVCGFSRCDCPEHMVLDKRTGYCYEFDNCPTNHAE